jgi:hypothetical protein
LKLFDLTTIDYDASFIDDPFGEYFETFIKNDSRRFFDRLQSISIDFSVMKLDFSDYTPDIAAQCIQWNVHKVYKYLPRGGHVDAILYVDYEHCSQDRSFKVRIYLPIVWLGLIIALCSLVSFCLSVKSSFHRLNILRVRCSVLLFLT